MPTACAPAHVHRSDKMDVQDHYTAWRTSLTTGPSTASSSAGDGHASQGQPHAAPSSPAPAPDAPFSFCAFPFLLDARAKTSLLHLEARFQMEQVRVVAMLRGVVVAMVIVVEEPAQLGLVSHA